MTVPLSKSDRIRKFKNLAFAALNRSTDGKTTCVQVGAHDGKRWDPVFGHITQNGWNALVIEPDPIYFERLSENYADHPNVTPVNVAISTRNRAFCYFTFPSRRKGNTQDGCKDVRLYM
jgi:hypothetical protein